VGEKGKIRLNRNPWSYNYLAEVVFSLQNKIGTMIIVREKMLKIGIWLNAMRLNQWMKGFWLLFILYGRPINSKEELFHIGLSLIIITTLSSAIYINNDIADIEKDKNHPTKRFRPFASGELGIKEGRIMFWILLIVTAILLGISGNVVVAILAIGMFFGNILYTTKVKHLPYMELLYYGFLFSLRYWIGSATLENNYFILQSFTVVFASINGLALLRYMEKERYGSGGRALLQKYNTQLLKKITILTGLVTIVSYFILSLSISPWLVISAIGYAYYLIRSMMAGFSNVENPEKVDDLDKIIFNDKTILFALLVFVCGMYANIVSTFM